jgi:hypothetical protein
MSAYLTALVEYVKAGYWTPGYAVGDAGLSSWILSVVRRRRGR